MTVEELRAQSVAFLKLLSNNSPAECARHADDLLLFLYRIRDAFPSFPFPGLAQLLHALESDPDSVFASEERRRTLTDLLQRLSSVHL
jgi:hypothetical protein